MTTRVDVAVIGGGIAGCVAATHLARGGMHVVLFEKQAVPHHKVCGEFISGEGLPYLDKLGIDLSGAAYIPHFRLHGPTRSCEAELPNAALGLSRMRLDELMLNAAARAGVDVRRGEPVKSLDRLSEGGFQIAPVVICAAGKAEFKPVQTRVGRDSGMVGFKVHLRLTPEAMARLEHHVDLFVFKNGYGGLAPIEDGLANLCFLLERDAIINQPAWASMADALGESCDGLAAYLEHSEPAFWPPVTVANVPYGFVRETAVADDLYCVGDQLAVIPSLTGEGMTIAMLSGRRAAEHILQGGNAAAFHAEMARILKPRVALGYQVHRLFKSPRVSDLGTQLVRRWPRLVDYIFRQTRAPQLLPIS